MGVGMRGGRGRRRKSGRGEGEGAEDKGQEGRDPGASVFLFLMYTEKNWVGKIFRPSGGTKLFKNPPFERENIKTHGGAPVTRADYFCEWQKRLPRLVKRWRARRVALNVARRPTGYHYQ